MKLPPYFSRLWRMTLKYKGHLALAFVGMIVTALTEPLFPAVMKVLLDKGFGGEPTLEIWLIPAAIIGIFILRGVSTFLTNYMMTWVSTKLLNELREKMFSRMLHVALAYFATVPIGQVINSLVFEAHQIIDMIRNVLTSLIRDVLTVLGLLGFLFWLNWRLTFIAMALLPMIAIIIRLTGRRLHRLNAEFREVNAEMTQVIEESTRAQQVIKIFGGQNYEQERFELRSARLRRFTMRMTSTQGATMPVTQLMAASAVAIVIVIALIQSSQNQTTVGGFVSFITAMLMLLAPLRRIAEVNGPLQRGMVAAESVFELIDAPQERSDGRELPHRSSGKIEFSHVDFAYPGRTQLVLNDINLVIQPGETIALVGMSGGGKSTLVNLVPEFYRPTKGEILLDDEPIGNISLKSLRHQIAMVSQQVVLFDDTVAANISYGDAEPDRKRVLAAAEAAHLSDFIDQLPEGLETRIGNNGMSLSGGQRQRLAIARALYKDAPILILDEATSALDTESERTVQAALETLMRGRTTLVIAHRLSTIENADRIVVMAEGKIVETGSHQELLAFNGMYASLHQFQFLKGVEA